MTKRESEAAGGQTELSLLSPWATDGDGVHSVTRSDTVTERSFKTLSVCVCVCAVVCGYKRACMRVCALFSAD